MKIEEGKKKLKKKSSIAKKIFIVINKIVKNVLKVFLICLILYSIIFNINKIFYKKEFVKIGKVAIITGDKSYSMEPEIKSTDLIITYNDEKINLQKNDIISYYINRDIYIQRVHNIECEDGKNYYITRGDNNLYANIEKITENDIIGKKSLKISLLGGIVRILQNSYICLFLIIFSIYMIIYKIAIYINIDKLFKQHK